MLIVEDDRAARKAISAILRREGYWVAEAGTVADALGVMSDSGGEGAPAWILLDLMLPDGSGIDVLRHVRHAKTTTRVCVVTGCCVDKLEEARQAGAEHAFVKPLDVCRLMSVLSS